MYYYMKVGGYYGGLYFLIFFQLAIGSRHLSQAEKEITVCKAEQIHKMTTQNDNCLHPRPF